MGLSKSPKESWGIIVIFVCFFFKTDLSNYTYTLYISNTNKPIFSEIFINITSAAIFVAVKQKPLIEKKQYLEGR